MSDYELLNKLYVPLIETLVTWQGEEPDSGKRVLLTRFRKCNRNCPWCDTKIKLNNSLEGFFKLSELDDRIVYENLGLLVTGGEPTIEENLKHTLNLLCYLNYAFAIVETNGYDLKQLLTIFNQENKEKFDKTKFVFSPKFFNEQETFNEMNKIKEYFDNYKNLFAGENGIFLRLVYRNDEYVDEYISHINKLGINRRVYLTTEGKTRDELLKRASAVHYVANHYNFNISSRNHIIYNFT